MSTLLLYLVFAAIIGAVVFLAAVFLFGRGERMAPLSPRTSPAALPESDIDGDDVRAVRFALALRGYRMSDVDWTLERLSAELDSLRTENAELRAGLGAPGDPVGEGGTIASGRDEDGGATDHAAASPVLVSVEKGHATSARTGEQQGPPAADDRPGPHE